MNRTRWIFFAIVGLAVVIVAVAAVLDLVQSGSRLQLPVKRSTPANRLRFL